MNLVRAELLKVTTTSLWWGFGLLLLPLWVASLLFNWANATSEPPGNEVQVTGELATSGQFFGIMVVLLLGAIMVTNEFHHLTATTTFLVTPRRERVIAAKFAAAIVIGLVVWAIVTGLNLVATPIVMADLNMPLKLGDTEVWKGIALNAVAFALWAILGVGCGVLIRSQLGATLILSTLYVLGTTVVTTLFFLLGDYVPGFEKLDFLVPTVASDLMISGQDLPDGPGRATGAAVLVAYALVTGALGTLIVKRRDIT
ncbi:ABC transporter permease [Actinoplanes sp. GCM10030250]|uniref:ABC transporter permease n=1 Tax=Actinoplanes sp. GCM10030250 TaxID=3273376 RepID=UPI0036209415